MHLPICDNPRGTIGNNKGTEIASHKDVKWFQFMNDDTVLQGTNFFSKTMEVSEFMPNAGSDVCELLTHGSEELTEAGIISLNDSSACGIGSDVIYHNSDDLPYTKPIDFDSGACLMLRKTFSQISRDLITKNFPTTTRIPTFNCTSNVI